MAVIKIFDLLELKISLVTYSRLMKKASNKIPSSGNMDTLEENRYLYNLSDSIHNQRF